LSCLPYLLAVTMDLSPSSSLKRKHAQDPQKSLVLATNDAHAEDTDQSSSAVAGALSPAEGGSTSTTVNAAVLAECHAALVSSSAVSRAALAKHQKFIDATLAKALKVVGSYPDEVANAIISCHLCILISMS